METARETNDTGKPGQGAQRRRTRERKRSKVIPELQVQENRKTVISSWEETDLVWDEVRETGKVAQSWKREAVNETFEQQ